MRGMALTLRNQDFVESLRAVGASNSRIILRHIIPNGIAPILVNASLALAGIVIAESALSFLGVGVQEPTPSWGNMLSTAQSYMFQPPWLPLVPGIPLCLVGHFVQLYRRRPARCAGSAVEAVDSERDSLIKSIHGKRD